MATFQNFRGPAIAVAVVLAIPSTVWPDDVVLQASKDNTLYESATGGLSNGAGATMFTGRTAQVSDSLRRALVAFDVVAGVPAGSTVTSVTLQLNMSKTNVVAGPRTIGLYKALADWGEGTSDAAVSDGAGTVSTTNDATWIHRFYNTTTWSSPGGDYIPTPSATQLVDAVGPVTWGSTLQMVADVQGWLDTPASNFGWIVIGDESTQTTAKRFDTRENPVPANRPALAVTYSPPAKVNDWELY